MALQEIIMTCPIPSYNASGQVMRQFQSPLWQSLQDEALQCWGLGKQQLTLRLSTTNFLVICMAKSSDAAPFAASSSLLEGKSATATPWTPCGGRTRLLALALLFMPRLLNLLARFPVNHAPILLLPTTADSHQCQMNNNYYSCCCT